MPPVTSRLREVREKRKQGDPQDFTLASLAGRVGIRERTLWAYEQGHHEPTVGIALALARELGVTVEDLAFGREVASPA